MFTTWCFGKHAQNIKNQFFSREFIVLITMRSTGDGRKTQINIYFEEENGVNNHLQTLITFQTTRQR